MISSRVWPEGANGFRAVSLFRRQLCVQQPVGHAEDAVQGRPGFVADGGQEFRFEARAFDCRVASLEQARLAVPQLS